MRRAVVPDHPAFWPLPSLVPWPTETECAWLAGFLDGEGTISLSVEGRIRAVRPRVTVTNTNLPNVGRARVLFRALLGHDVYPRPYRDIGRRPAFVLSIDKHEDIRSVLRALYPCFVGKQPQAKLMLEYLEECSWALFKGSRPRRDTPDIKARRLEFAFEMRKLNRRYRKGEWDAFRDDGVVGVGAIHPEGPTQRAERSAEPDAQWERVKTLLTLRGDH